MKRAVICGLILIGIFVTVRAEAEFSFEEVQAAADPSGEKIELSEIFQRMISGEMPFALDEIPETVVLKGKEIIGKTAAMLTETIAYVLAGAVFKMLLPDGKHAGGAAKVLRLTVIVALFRIYLSASRETQRSMAAMESLSEALAPCLSTLLTLTGGTQTAAVITPMGAFASGVISRMLSQGGQALVGIAAALTAGCALGGVRLARLREMVFGFAKWMIGACLGASLMLLNTGGLIAGAQDGTVMKGAKYVAGSLIPIVGSEIAGKMESLAASAALVRSAAGVTGLIAVLTVSAEPVLRLIVCAWGIRLIAAVSETVGDEDTPGILEGFSRVMLLLCALICAAACVLLILLGCAIAMGSRIGT